MLIDSSISNRSDGSVFVQALQKIKAQRLTLHPENTEELILWMQDRTIPKYLAE